MKSPFENIVEGLNEAILETKSTKKTLKRQTYMVIPIKKYNAKEVKMIRTAIGFSQKNFAVYMGVSQKTVEAWESGINQPSGAASRLLNMLELDSNLVNEFPFVSVK